MELSRLILEFLWHNFSLFIFAAIYKQIKFHDQKQFTGSLTS